MRVVSPDILRTQDYSDVSIPDAQVRFDTCSVSMPHGFMFGEVLDGILTQWKAFKRWKVAKQNLSGMKYTFPTVRAPFQCDARHCNAFADLGVVVVVSFDPLLDTFLPQLLR